MIQGCFFCREKKLWLYNIIFRWNVFFIKYYIKSDDVQLNLHETDLLFWYLSHHLTWHCSSISDNLHRFARNLQHINTNLFLLLLLNNLKRATPGNNNKNNFTFIFCRFLANLCKFSEILEYDVKWCDYRKYVSVSYSFSCISINYLYKYMYLIHTCKLEKQTINAFQLNNFITVEFVVKFVQRCFFSIITHKNDECVTTIEIDIATLTANTIGSNHL